ncbi:polysaccharide deacetylase family protein [Listeria sp. PSOL-1]|uniref:polysaccharide deacetylase family protein n=1 Tax=Listeria sp. PSOL-1 TaxID=1844999 RepID=UPI0013D22F40|nr:polysaccharide deacetylase family protein [Listeria sp. PSOL-1]
MKKTSILVIVCCLAIFLSACSSNKISADESTKSERKQEKKEIRDFKKKKAEQPTRDLPKEKVTIPVLMYHSINQDVRNSLIVKPSEFAEQMKWLKDQHYTTIDMDELANMLKTGKNIPEKPVVITFDDGYLDNYQNAYPILKKYQFKATIFVITDKIGQDNHFDQRAMKEMSKNGIKMESHTVTHRELNQLDYVSQLKELTDSKKTISEITGKPVVGLCYPVGRFNADTEKAAKESGYELGFTTKPGFANENKGMYQLPRVRMAPGIKLDSVLPK